MKSAVRIALVFVAVALLAAFTWLADAVDRTVNAVSRPPPYVASPRAEALYRTLRVVDLHADPLLWGRDILERIDHGQVDVPRLIEGGVALQVFGVVTQSPRSQNFESTPADDLDLVTLLTIFKRLPLQTWWSRLARAEQMSEELFAASGRSQGQLQGIRAASDLRVFLAARASNPAMVAGLVGLEGMHALEGDLAGLDALFDAGVRMMAPTHFFDNAVGGSAAGVEKYGLTQLGKQAILRAEKKGVVIDLAHASPATIRDVFALVTGPVVVSHTGVQATCPGPRNLSDDEIRGVAATGGVVGIAYFVGAVCGQEPKDIARAMRHVRDLVGAEHVALGSDFDGGVTTRFDSTGLAQIVDALFAENFSEAEVRAAMGENTLRVLLERLP